VKALEHRLKMSCKIKKLNTLDGIMSYGIIIQHVKGKYT